MDIRDDSRTNLTRRRFLEAAAIAPLAFRGQAATTQADLLELGAREAVDRIRRGEMKAEGYVAELLKQYNAHKDLNLVTSIDEARVLEAARSVDRARARGAKLGPAAGLPFAVKDQIEVAGYPATAGNGALRGYVPKRNAVVVERTFENPTPAAVIAALGLNAPMSSPETMAQWLREHAPDVSVEMMYRGRPMLDRASPTLPPVDEQIKILTEASQRYAEVYRAHGVSAIAFPTIPIIAMPIRQGGPKEPFGEMITLNGQQMEEGKALIGLRIAIGATQPDVQRMILRQGACSAPWRNVGPRTSRATRAARIEPTLPVKAQ